MSPTRCSAGVTRPTFRLPSAVGSASLPRALHFPYFPMSLIRLLAPLGLASCNLVPAALPSAGLVGHWPLGADARDHSGAHRHGTSHGVRFESGAARFDGRAAWIEVPRSGLPFGRGDFTIAVRVHLEKELDDVPGDLLSAYDPATRRGVNLGVLSLPGSTASQPNDRNVAFGIDNAKLEPWVDHGRLGASMYVTSLCVFDGALYAATTEELGRVYRFDGDRKWIDCGAPDQANGIMAMAVLDGQLYVGSGRYRLRGSALPETQNQAVGGSVFRYKGGKEWEDCGKVSAETETIGGLVAFRGRLYASSAYRPAGLFRYEGGRNWTPLGSFNGRRSEALGIHNGRIYTSVWDGGSVFEFDGERFGDLGTVDGNTQTYGFVNHGGELMVATWPKGRMYRWGGGQTWIDAGRLGEETEVMATAHYNGKVYAGTLPLAKVFRYDGGTQWTDLGQLDHTPSVTYRRAWSAAVYRGRLFIGTLPEGKVHSIAAGRVATVDRSLAPGWRHVTAVRRAGKLEVFIDGAKAAESAGFTPADYDLMNDRPLRVGTGENDFFNGRMADLRIYDRALSAAEIGALARQAK